MKRFRGGLVFKAHRLLYHSTLGLRVIKKRRRHAGCRFTPLESIHDSVALKMNGSGGERPPTATKSITFDLTIPGQMAPTHASVELFPTGMGKSKSVFLGGLVGSGIPGGA